MLDLKSSLATAATAIALATWPAYGADKAPTIKSENVSAQTRQKVADLKLQFPNFKLLPDTQSCIDDKLIDPECEPTILLELEWHIREEQIKANEKKIAANEKKIVIMEWALAIKKSQLAIKEQQLAAKEQQIIAMQTTRESIDIVMWLVQLWLYIDQDRQPPKNADYIAIVMNNPNIPKEVQSLFTEFLNRKKSGTTFNGKTDGEQLLALANKYLKIADSFRPQITDESVKNMANILYAQAADLNNKLKMILSRKG